MIATTTRELAFRATDGLEVALLWRKRDGRLAVTVSDAKTGDSFEVLVESGEKPLDVLSHPFAYAAFHGVEYATAAREPGVAAYA